MVRSNHSSNTKRGGVYWVININYLNKRIHFDIKLGDRPCSFMVPRKTFNGLQHVFSVTIFRLPRPQDVLKTPWRHLARRKIATLTTTSRRHEDMSWRRLRDKQNVYWGYLYLTNLNVYLINLYFTNIYLTNLRWIQSELVSIFVLFLKDKQHFYFKN